MYGRGRLALPYVELDDLEEVRRWLELVRPLLMAAWRWWRARRRGVVACGAVVVRVVHLVVAAAVVVVFLLGFILGRVTGDQAVTVVNEAPCPAGLTALQRAVEC